MQYGRAQLLRTGSRLYTMVGDGSIVGRYFSRVRLFPPTEVAANGNTKRMVATCEYCLSLTSSRLDCDILGNKRHCPICGTAKNGRWEEYKCQDWLGNLVCLVWRSRLARSF